MVILGPGTCKRAFILLALLILVGCSAPDQEKSTVVMGASSATDLIVDLAGKFENEHRVGIETSFASTSTLARQISEGAHFDFFISADPEWVNYLKMKNPGKYQARPFLSNQMVLISSKDLPGIESLEDLRGSSGLIALGNPDHVPSGKYAKLCLQNLGLWDLLKPRMVPTGNVREALRLVQAGECEFGIVYQSDARLVGKPGLILPMPDDARIGYQIMWHAKGLTMNQRRFLEFLYSPQAKELAIKMGFEWQEELEAGE